MGQQGEGPGNASGMGTSASNEAMADQAEAVRAEIERRMEESPWALLGIAAAAGYVAGGGLFSPVTRYLSRIALAALLVPTVRQRARGAASEARAAFEGSGWESQQGSRPEPGF